MLVNNAGVVQGKLIVDLSPRDIHQCGAYYEPRFFDSMNT